MRAAQEAEEAAKTPRDDLDAAILTAERNKAKAKAMAKSKAGGSSRRVSEGGKGLSSSSSSSSSSSPSSSSLLRRIPPWEQHGNERGKESGKVGSAPKEAGRSRRRGWERSRLSGGGAAVGVVEGGGELTLSPRSLASIPDDLLLPHERKQRQQQQQQQQRGGGVVPLRHLLMGRGEKEDVEGGSGKGRGGPDRHLTDMLKQVKNQLHALMSMGMGMGTNAAASTMHTQSTVGNVGNLTPSSILKGRGQGQGRGRGRGRGQRGESRQRAHRHTTLGIPSLPGGGGVAFSGAGMREEEEEGEEGEEGGRGRMNRNDSSAEFAQERHLLQVGPNVIIRWWTAGSKRTRHEG